MGMESVGTGPCGMESVGTRPQKDFDYWLMFADF